MTDLLEPQRRESPAKNPLKAKRAKPWRRSLIVDAHNVMGFFAAGGVIVVSVTGILLNHTDWFGLTKPAPAAEKQPAVLSDVQRIEVLVQAAQRATMQDGQDPGLPPELDRAAWKPADGIVEVRLDTKPIVAVTVDASSGKALDKVVRHDLIVTDAHSGGLAGKHWVILSDIVGLVLIVSVVTGAAVWLRRVRQRGRLVGARSGSSWIRANWWFHLVGGLVASAHLVILSVTGMLLNHKQPLGFMATSPDVAERPEGFRSMPLLELVDAAVRSRGPEFDSGDVKSLDYRPEGYAKVRFSDKDYEVMVDAADGTVLKSSRRWDVWIEDLHSGLLFGEKGWLLSDVAGGLAILLTVNGLYLWTRPGWRVRNDRPAE